MRAGATVNTNGVGTTRAVRLLPLWLDLCRQRSGQRSRQRYDLARGLALWVLLTAIFGAVTVPATDLTGGAALTASPDNVTTQADGKTSWWADKVFAADETVEIK